MCGSLDVENPTAFLSQRKQPQFIREWNIQEHLCFSRTKVPLNLFCVLVLNPTQFSSSPPNRIQHLEDQLLVVSRQLTNYTDAGATDRTTDMKVQPFQHLLDRASFKGGPHQFMKPRTRHGWFLEKNPLGVRSHYGPSRNLLSPR